MKYILYMVVFMSCICAHSQNYQLIDNKVKNYGSIESLEALVTRFNSTFKTDEQKVRAFYSWICFNVDYDINKNSMTSPELYVTFDSEYMNRSIAKQRRQKLASSVFKNKRGMCLGLSTLFQELCMLSGIEAEVVEGVVRMSVDDIDNSRHIKNHAWNVVKIDGQWQLIDLTFSSGYENDQTGSWESRFNDFYFFTDPDKFILTHFPADSNYQLLKDKITTEQFFEQPMFYARYFESGLEISDHQNGFLTASEIDNKIRLKFKSVKYEEQISYKFNHEKYAKQLPFERLDLNQYVASLKNKSKKATVLSLYYNNEIILDFKIKK